jgi:PAS domain S-box-containing protein
MVATPLLNQRGKFHQEVVNRLGLLPNFFCSAAAAPELITRLWEFARSGYFDNPLPSLFKERLFVYVSRFCPVRYCVIRHVGFLVGAGFPAGDASCPSQTMEQVVALLKRPVPGEADLDAALARLESAGNSAQIPPAETQREYDLFDALTLLMMEPRRSARARRAVGKAFGDAALEYLTAFLAFIRTAHFWTETHPEIEIEPDMTALMTDNEELAQLLLKSPESLGTWPLTERASAEAALRYTEEQGVRRLAAIVESSDDAIISKDLNGAILSWNSGAERLFGYAPEEVVGKPGTILVPQDRQDEEPEILDRIRRGERVEHYETVRRRKDGRMLDVSLTVSPVRDPQGRIVGSSKNARDITQRKLAEDQIRQAQERLDLALKGADLAIWDWNVKTGEVIFNQRWAEMRGFRPEEIKPHVDSCFSGIHADDRPRVLQSLQDCLNGVNPDFECEYRISTKIGVWIWISDRGKVFARDEEGRATRMAGTELDITERKRAEEALRVSEAAAKRATQARDDMLRIVAHDLRNPLAAVAALAAVLQKTGAEQEIGEEIEQATRRMNRLIRDIIDATQLETGGLAINRERVPTHDVLSQVLNSQTPLISSASLELSLDAVPGLPDVWVDRDRLLQVFENLVGNATKFTKPSGRVVVGARAGAGEVLFSVSDTGCGIESDHLARVFDRFWQAPETRHNGLGLGLPIVKGIIEAHGGRVWVQSSPGRGSTFSFTMPVAAEAPRA